ncbi:hypothetical protein HPB51_012757 [Rhipicephalus microplus]|uniref:Uncharacterized protein n=1 Tax=Rhipicephalus microplus TaxID=6941 RepID=A0A9J6EAH3_RHIMP|nr:hypothetical protein HPB51_012757 [Rhipicephalus microplus]
MRCFRCCVARAEETIVHIVLECGKIGLPETEPLHTALGYAGEDGVINQQAVKETMRRLERWTAVVVSQRAKALGGAVQCSSGYKLEHTARKSTTNEEQIRRHPAVRPIEAYADPKKQRSDLRWRTGMRCSARCTLQTHPINERFNAHEKNILPPRRTACCHRSPFVTGPPSDRTGRSS